VTDDELDDPRDGLPVRTEWASCGRDLLTMALLVIVVGMICVVLVRW
jgi:hypothetical protein